MVSQRRVDKGDDLYLIPAEGDPLRPVGSAVRGAVEDERRTALMRTHSGLHVLSGVVFRDFGALVVPKARRGGSQPGNSGLRGRFGGLSATGSSAQPGSSTGMRSA